MIIEGRLSKHWSKNNASEGVCNKSNTQLSCIKYHKFLEADK